MIARGTCSIQLFKTKAEGFIRQFLYLKRKKYTLEQHRELGKELKHIRRRLQEINIEFLNTYGLKKTRVVDQAISRIDHFRSILDDILFREHPDRPYADLKDIYY